MWIAMCEDDQSYVCNKFEVAVYKAEFSEEPGVG
jgi:hypothetical protein